MRLQYVDSLKFFFLNGSKPNFCIPQEEERRPTKKAKRPRKTVKSAAIINDEPEGPSTESVVASREPSEPTSGLKRSGGIIIQWDEKDKSRLT